MKHKQSLCVISFCLILIGSVFVEVGAFDPRDLEKLNATGMCKSCILIRANLAGANLSNSDLNQGISDRSGFIEGKFERCNIELSSSENGVSTRERSN